MLLIFLLHVQGTLYLPFVERMENLAYDLRLNWLAPGAIDPRIVIVDIDEKSLREEGHWPWDRAKLRSLVDNLFAEYGVRLVAFDVVFAEKDENHALNELDRLLAHRGDVNAAGLLRTLRPLLDRDAIFAQGLAGRPVVLGYYFNHDPDMPTAGALPAPAFPADSLPAVAIMAPQATGYGGNLAGLQASAASAGFFSNPLVDVDGVFRRDPLLTAYQGALYESLALAVVRIFLQASVEAEFADDTSAGYPPVEALVVAGNRIPVDENAAALVPYRGPKGSFPYVSATDVLRKQVARSELLKNTIVLVGTTAPGLVDARSTPVQNFYPGVEVHANLIAGILDQRILQKPAYTRGAELVILLAIGLLMTFLLPRLGPISALAASLGVLAATVGGNLYIWQAGNLVLPLASSLLLILCLFTLNVSYGFFFESRSKRHLGKLFGQYVPPELVVEMSKDPERYNLAGEKRELTVLFTDVRGFTGISEGLDPRELSHLMTEFLTPMTRVIHQHRGTIDKYMGDAIMAFWGAPISDPAHAQHALAAGLEMIAQADTLSAQFRERGWPEIRIGVGLNTGEMNVGNMGSRFRMAYTVLGDAVNLGSRLEGLTKSYGVSMIVSESTRNAAPEFAYRELDRVRVKGKDRAVTIFEPLGVAAELTDVAARELSVYGEALAAYRGRDWNRADSLFTELCAAAPATALYRIYLERIAHFRQHPPGADWDGVFVHSAK